MAANIRYIAKASNRLRAGITVGTQQVLSAIVRSTDLSFETKAKTRFSYSGNPETIVLGEYDNQDLVISYIDEALILQVREFYKSVSDGSLFEINLDGLGVYENCILTTRAYKESRIGDTLEYSVALKVRWL